MVNIRTEAIFAYFCHLRLMGCEWCEQLGYMVLTHVQALCRNECTYVAMHEHMRTWYQAHVLPPELAPRHGLRTAPRGPSLMLRGVPSDGKPSMLSQLVTIHWPEAKHHQTKLVGQLHLGLEPKRLTFFWGLVSFIQGNYTDYIIIGQH